MGRCEGVKLLRVGVLASGRGSNAQAIIDNCRKEAVAAEVAVVVSDKADAKVLARASSQGIEAVHVDPGAFPDKAAYESEVVRVLGRSRVEAVCLAGYMRLVGRVLLEAYPMRILNIHPALLPSFKGLHGQRDALEYGVKVSGCTVHFVDAGMDTGPIIAQAAVRVLEDDTVESLSARILEEEHRIYSEALDLLARGLIEVRGRRVLVR